MNLYGRYQIFEEVKKDFEKFKPNSKSRFEHFLPIYKSIGFEALDYPSFKKC